MCENGSEEKEIYKLLDKFCRYVLVDITTQVEEDGGQLLTRLRITTNVTKHEGVQW